jgi:CIC family chloride channel protein
MIVFEMTGDWQAGLAVMVAVAVSTSLASKFVARSFFLEQLERRGVRLAAGPQAYLLAMIPVKTLLREMDHPRMADIEACNVLIAENTYVVKSSSLEVALPLFEGPKHAFLPVVASTDTDDAPELVGALFQVDALRAYSQAMAETAKEEHS